MVGAPAVPAQRALATTLRLNGAKQPPRLAARQEHHAPGERLVAHELDDRVGQLVRVDERRLGGALPPASSRPARPWARSVAIQSGTTQLTRTPVSSRA